MYLLRLKYSIQTVETGVFAKCLIFILLNRSLPKRFLKVRIVKILVKTL